MADDAVSNVSKAVEGAKHTLANANAFTHSVTGDATNAFAPKKILAPHVPQAHAPAHPSNASYSLASEARNVGESLKAKSDNVNQYIDSNK
jgi:hypothetical protein